MGISRFKVISVTRKNFKMYYGNPSASAVSDGDKVFEFLMILRERV